MLRPRFTLRWLMLAVAVAGAIMGAVVIERRRAFYSERARYHAGCSIRDINTECPVVRRA